MRSIRARGLLAGLITVFSANAWAQPGASPLHVALLIASDYKQNGLSQTRSDPVLRISADFEHVSGFFAGGAIANADYASDRRRLSQRDTQTNFYTGYSWRGTRWSSNVFASRYIYAGYSPSYNYTETTLGTSYRDRYFLSYSRSNDYYSRGQRTDQLRAGLALPWVSELEVSLNGGRFRTRGAFNTEYSFWDVGVSRVLGRFALDLRYHDNSYNRTSFIGEDGDERWVFSVSYAVIPRDRGPEGR